MTVTRDFNLGTVVTICIFLIVQTTGAVWWAATISAEFDSLRNDVQRTQMQLADALEREKAERVEDRRRIFDRIVTSEQVVSEITSESKATRAIIEGLDRQLTALRDDVKENNSLLRSALVDLGKANSNRERELAR